MLQYLTDFSFQYSVLTEIKAMQPDIKPGTVFRDILRDGGESPEMVVIPAGQFQMGDIQGTGFDWERPVHDISIECPFAMGCYPVMVEEFKKFIELTGYKTEAEKKEGAYVWKKGEWKKLKNASWVADTGRFYDFLKSGNANEVEPYPDFVIVNLSALVDAAPWAHDLPDTQKP